MIAAAAPAAATALPDWVVQLWLYQPILLVLSTLFGGLYVYFTIRTFQQIKRQTEIQIEAFLLVAAEKVPSGQVPRRAFPAEAVKLHKKWADILKKNIPNAVQPDRWLILRLTNRGRSDIVGWRIDIRATVHPGKLASMLTSKGEEAAWQVLNETHEDFIPTESGVTIQVPIAILGPFPRIEFTWSIRYEDTRNKVYTTFGGDAATEDVNAFAYP